MRKSWMALAMASLAATVVGGGPAAWAESIKPVMGGVVRLIAAERQGSQVTFGLAIDLEPGWKTYWRYPGDSGVPPLLDWTGSQNVAAVAVEFPAPERIREGSDQTIGYHGSVVLPLRVTLADPKAVTELHLKAQLGFCREICVPIEADLERELDVEDKAAAEDVTAIAAATRAVPQPTKAGDDLSVVKLELDRTTKPETVTATIKTGSVALKDVFVEGPEGWALPLPERTDASGETSRWRFALDGLPSAATVTGAKLTFTIVGSNRATTQTVPLD